MLRQKVKKAMAENEIPLSDRNKTVPKAAKTSSARTQTIRTQNTKVQNFKNTNIRDKENIRSVVQRTDARTYSTGKKDSKK